MTSSRERSVSAAAARSTTCTTRGASPRAIGIPHYIVNFEHKFQEHVISDFVRGVRGRPDADSVRALQRRPEVRLARGAGAGLWRRGGRDGALRAGGVRRGHAALSPEEGRRRPEGPVVFPLHADAGAARARALPRRRPGQGCRARGSAAARADASRRRRTARRSASSPRASIRSSSAGARTYRGAPSATARDTSSAGTTASTASRSASARASASRPASRCTSSASTRRTPR